MDVIKEWPLLIYQSSLEHLWRTVYCVYIHIYILFLQNDSKDLKTFHLCKLFLELFSLYLAGESQRAFSYKSQTRMQLWQVGNYFCCLSLHLFACLSLNYRTVPTVPVRVKQLRGCRPLWAIPGGAPIGTSWFLCCASAVDGGFLDFPVAHLYAEMNWHALLEQPSKNERERESEEIYSWQG